MSQVLPEPNTEVHLSSMALDWALSHARRYGDTVFLPRAFEYEAIEHDWPRVRAWLEKQDMRKWSPRHNRRILTPKNLHAFRYVTQLDPLEYLAVTGLLYEVGPELEKTRVPQAEKTVYSWRFSLGENGQMYDPESEWLQFTRRCEDLAKNSGSHCVVVADIADFFPRIYLHPVERALARATAALPQAYCLLRHIRNWNALVSYGLPVGVSVSRIVAEATMNDIDQGLAGARLLYCRYADDIRIFCPSEADARRALELLARLLFENHGHTLQPQKTGILPVSDYLARFDISHERLEAESLTERFSSLLEKAGVEDSYEKEIDYDELPEDVRTKIDQLNLVEVLREQLALERIDPIVVKILLHRLGQLNAVEAVDDVLENLSLLRHVMDSVVRYFRALREMSPSDTHSIGRRVLDVVCGGSVGEYEKLCLLSLFTWSTEYDNEGRFEPLLSQETGAVLKRELILALGRAQKEHWFQAMRRDLGSLDSWSKRAFLAAYSCVSPDARIHYYRSLRGGADVLEASIIDWVQTKPFLQP